MYQISFTRLLVIVSVTVSSVYNVPTARKSFDLRVPGKAPIRVMEAEPPWGGDEAPATSSEEFEHRTMKSNFRFRHTTPQSEEISTENSAAYQTAHYPSAKLEEFLKNYANKLNSKKNGPMRDMDEVKLLTRPSGDEDEAHFPETYGEDPVDNRQDAKQDKANKWDLIHVQKYQQPIRDNLESNRYHGGVGGGSSEQGGSSSNNKYTPTKIYTLNNNFYDDSFSNTNHKDKDSNKQGWVTLEAVPWSISKISKWQSNQQNKNKRPWQDSYGSNSDKYTDTNKYSSTKPWHSSHNGYYGSTSDNPNPWEHYTSTVAYRPEKPSYKPAASYRPHSSYFNRPGPDYDKDEIDAYGGIGSRPPIADYDQNLYNRPIISTLTSSNPYQELASGAYSERPWNTPSLSKPSQGTDYGRPYWNKLSQLHHNQQYHPDGSKCDHRYKIEKGDIITDGLPGNFPKEATNRRRGVEPEEQQEQQELQLQPDKSQDHPETHPANGNGEWVLLSTTKGYQRPVERQRSLKIIPAQRQVRLTVLPPDKDSNVNMTTSHGGLLEVESTFQTVEQDQKRFAKQQRFNATQISAVLATAATNPRPSKPLVHTRVHKVTKNSNRLDSSAVVAAVGAGMIPAAAIGAMLVPMAMGRKKRSLFTTTHHPLEEYQLTLPRSL